MNSKQIRNELGSDMMSKLHLSELHESYCFWINDVIHYNLVKDYDNGNSCREYGDFTNCTGKWQLYVKKNVVDEMQRGEEAKITKNKKIIMKMSNLRKYIGLFSIFLIL